VIKIKGDDSYYENPTGIPQGSALGPLLFSMFINDVCEVIDVEYILYADDLVIYTNGTDEKCITERLRANLLNVDHWCRTNHVKINFEKTEFMLFNKSNDKSIYNEGNRINEIKVGMKTVKRVDNFKYLGLRFDSNMNFNGHYDFLIDKISGKLSYMYGIKRFLTPSLLKVMINSYVHSVADYC